MESDGFGPQGLSSSRLKAKGTRLKAPPVRTQVHSLTCGEAAEALDLGLDLNLNQGAFAPRPGLREAVGLAERNRQKRHRLKTCCPLRGGKQTDFVGSRQATEKSVNPSLCGKSREAGKGGICGEAGAISFSLIKCENINKSPS